VHHLRVLAVWGAIVLLVAPAFAQAPAAQQSKARDLAARGVGVYDKGDYAAALELFTEADRAYPTPQYRIFRGRSLARLGKLASAGRLFDEAAFMRRPDPVPRGFDEAQRLARVELAELRPRIPVLRIEVEDPSDAHVSVDGQEVAPGGRERVEVDPGEHLVEASAPGFEPWSRTVTLEEHGVFSLTIHLVRTSPPPLAPSPPPPPPAEPAVTLSHRSQLGASVRVDVDPLTPGARVVPGVTYGILDFFEVGAAAILGIHTSGFEPRATAYILRGAFKPFVDVGVPVFIVQGARPGLRGSAGVQWDPMRHIGLFAQAGGAYFFDPPLGYLHAVFLPALGVQGRL
jgi:hypothetical protein